MRVLLVGASGVLGRTSSARSLPARETMSPRCSAAGPASDRRHSQPGASRPSLWGDPNGRSSIGFAYAPGAEPVAGELASLFLDAPDPWGLTCRAVATMEGLVTGTPGLDGVVLRYGSIYGPGTSFASDGVTAEAVRRGTMAAVQGGTGRWSFLHVDDAAAAAVLAVSGGPAGVYNIVDDDPAAHDDWLRAFAAALDAPEPSLLSPEEAYLSWAWYNAYRATDCPGASNGRARQRLGWAPSHLSWLDALGRN